MLLHLNIRNFAIVDALELEFAPGMSVLTGETGAGKSILLDALGLTLGDRADSGVVRHGQERAEVIATFGIDALPSVADWLAGHELDADGECIVRRTVNADGGSRGFINGRPAPLQLLRELGEQLVDIHGQHAHQSLLRRDAQREVIDAAGHGDQLAAVAAAYRTWRDLSDERADLARARADRDARLDLLRYQFSELDALALADGELEALNEEHQRLANVSRLQEGAQRTAELLSEGETFTAAALLDRAAAELGELTGYDGALCAVVELVEGAAIQAKEAASEVRRYLASLDAEPERLDAVESRLADIQGLARKHRCDPAALPALADEMRDELARLDSAEMRLEGLDRSIAVALDDYLSAATRLTASRAAAADRLADQVTANMQELGMKGGRFAIELHPDPEQAPSPTGLERPEFLVSANPGQPPRPLAKVASGGELSRIALAIQVLAAGRAGIPTLIFDEVDVGVGGGVAEMVGRKLRELGSGRQVLCVTHQPQVAALGHHHLLIRKKASAQTTQTQVEPLDGETRVEELARMLGGMAITEQTLGHAREMLALARQSEGKPRRKKA